MKTSYKQIILSLFLALGISSNTPLTAANETMVGRIPGSFSTDVSGAATYTIPIECPQGINNMQPNLSLLYSSMSNNGIAGWGWNLSGLSSIMRTPKTIYYDGKNQEITWNNTDSLLFDGQRMMAVRRWNKDSIEFRLESDPTTMIRAYNIQEWGASYFKAFTKSGMIATYGDPQISSSYILMYADAHTGSGPAKAGWNLTEIRDGNGNYMKIDYITSLGNNRGNAVSKITYGGNKRKGINGNLTLSFEYEKRPDEIQGFVAGKEALQQLRLIKIKTTVNSIVQKEYRLSYQSGKISRLASIELYDRGVKQFDPLTFTYGEEDMAKSDIDVSFIRKDESNNEKDKRGLTAVDLDGDGYNEFGDIYYRDESGSIINGLSRCYFDIHKKSQSWVATQRFPVAFNMDKIQFSIKELFADFNGNGSAESLFAYFDGIVSGNQGAPLTIRITDRSKDSILCEESLHYTANLPFIATGSYFGNPLANALIIYDDPQQHSGGYIYHYNLIMSNIEGHVYAYNDDMFLVVPSKIKYATTAKLSSISYRDDIWLILEDGTTRILKNNQSEVAACFSNAQVINTGLNMGKDDLHTFGDLNNDGLLDLIFRRDPNNWEIALNKGDGTFTTSPLSISCAIQRFEGENDNVFLVDLNNDNLLDIVTGDEGMRGGFFCTWHFYLNNGDGTFELYRIESSREKASYTCLADLLGKGTVNWLHADIDGKVFITDLGFGRHKNLLTKVNNPVSPALELKYKPQAECHALDGVKDYTNNCNSYKDYLRLGYLPFKTTQMPIASESYDGRTRITYDYGTALINWLHRGYMGFRYQKAYDVTNRIRVETTSKIYASNKKYNLMLPYQTNKYIGPTSSDKYFSENYDYIIKPFEGNRFALQQSSHGANDYLSNMFNSENYVYDNYNNITQYAKSAVGQTLAKQLEYAAYGAWCPNVITSETIKETQDDDELTKTNRYYYSSNGNLIQLIADYGNANAVNTQITRFDDFGHPTDISKTANGQTRTSRTSYSNSGRFITYQKNELGEEISQEWDENRGLVTKKTDRIGTTTYAYSPFGSLITTTYPDGKVENQQLAWATVIPSPVPEGKYATTSVLSGNSPTTIWYDEYGQEVTRKTIGVNSKEIYAHIIYQGDGKVSVVSKPTFDNYPGNSWDRIYEYDEYGRVTRITTPKGDITTEYTVGADYSGELCGFKIVTTPDSHTETAWDKAGLTRQSSVNGKMVTFSHTVGGKIKTATPENGSPVIFQYDRNGNRTQINDPNTSVINSEYDAWGQLTKETQSIHKNGSGNTVTTYTYSPAGLLQKKQIGSAITNYVYDIYNRLTRMYPTYSSDAEKTYTYDNYDRVTQMTRIIDDPYGSKKTLTSKKEYDAYGRIIKEIYPSGYFINNAYDAYGNLISVTDKAFRKIWELKNCDAEGHILEEKKGNITTTYTYSSSGELISIVSPNIIDMHYTYSTTTGNLKTYEDRISGQTEYYAYDTMDRLSQWNKVNADYQIDNISYDSKGRITSKSDILDSQRDYYYENPTAYNALTSLDYSNRLSDRNIAYTSFKKVSMIEGTDMRYEIKYGVDQERAYSFQTGKNVPVIYRYYTENYEENNMPSNFSYMHYIYGGNGLAAIYKESMRLEEFFPAYTDRQGSLVALTYANGNIVQRYAYDPWGNRRNPSNWNEKESRTDLIAYRGYTMHEHMDHFGLINMNGRVYEPLTGLFLSPDPQLQSPENWMNYNRYSYCMNNPLKYTDPSGEWFLIDDLIAAAVGFVCGYVTHGITTGNWGWKAVASGGIGAGMAWLGYNTMGGSMSGWEFAGKNIANTTLGFITPPIDFKFGDLNLSINPMAMFTTGSIDQINGFILGMGISASYEIGDWALYAGIGSGSKYVGFGYFDGEIGGSWHTTKYSTTIDGGSPGQRTATVGFRYKDFSISHENDVIYMLGDGGDRFRSAALELGYKDYVLGANVYTNNPKIDGLKKGTNTYKNGIQYSSPLYLGKKVGYGMVRIGLEHPAIGNSFQNGFHALIGSPYLKESTVKPYTPYVKSGRYYEFSKYY